MLSKGSKQLWHTGVKDGDWLTITSGGNLVLRRSEGTIGEMATLLSAAADTAFRSGRERIAPETIEAADYQPPSIRRRMFERAMR